MASFVPHYKKKQLQLRQLEGELLALLQKGGGEEAALHAAEGVLEARVRVLREKMAKLVPSEKNAGAIEGLRREIEELRGVKAGVVLEEFRRRMARVKGAVVIPRAPRRGEW